MSSGLTFWGLCLLWIGAMAFGLLLILRGRWEQAVVDQGSGDQEAVPNLPSLPVRKALEAACLFAGSGGSILGLGLLGMGAMR